MSPEKVAALAILYEEGEITPADLLEATELYREAIMAGNIDSIRWLLKHATETTEKRYWNTKLAEAGHKMAQGRIALDEICTSEDIERPLAALSRLAKEVVYLKQISGYEAQHLRDKDAQKRWWRENGYCRE